MLKSTIVLAGLCAQLVFAQYYTVKLTNDAGRWVLLTAGRDVRPCYCVSNTQTATIFHSYGGGSTKLFSRSDCTGNYSTLKAGASISNAYWVNSISFGNPNVASTPTGDGCPNYYN